MPGEPKDTSEAVAYPEFLNGTEACASAADPDIFFVHGTAEERSAKALCRKCTLRDECLEWALATDQRFGIWGAANYRDRRKIKRKRGQR